VETVNLVGGLLKREYLFVSLVWVAGFVFYLLILTRRPLMYGIDGPYYLIQVRSLLETGSLAYGDPPLSFFLFTFFTILLRGDITLGVRVGVALFSALSAVPLYFLVKRITRLELAGYVAMLVSIFSAPHIRMINDLLKNAVGVCLLLFFVYFLHEIVFGGRKGRTLFLALFSLLLTGATHILDFGVALLFLILYLAFAILLDVDRGLVVKDLGILALSVGFFACIALIVFPSLFTDFFKGLSFLQDLFTASGEADPILFLLDPIGGVLTMPILAVGLVLSVHEWRMRKKEDTLSLAAVTATGLMLSLPFIPQQWLWRFMLMEFIPISFIVGYGVSKIKMESKVMAAIFLIIIIFPVVIQGLGAARPRARYMSPTISEEGYHELEAIAGIIPSDSVVVVDPSVMYWVEYVTRCDIHKGLSPTLWQSYEHVLALFQKPLQLPHIPPGVILFDGKEFLLVGLYRPLGS